VLVTKDASGACRNNRRFNIVPAYRFDGSNYVSAGEDAVFIALPGRISGLF
jgi:hypothetical protein